MTNTVTGKSDALAKLRADLEAKYDWLALGRSAAPGPSISAPSASALHQNTEPDYAMVVPFRYFSQRDRSKETPIAAIVHIYYPEMAEELSSYLANLSSSACVYVSTNTDEKRSIIEDVFRRSHIENHEIRIVPNRGRDIAPKLITFADVYERHDYVVHLHSKRSLHIGRGTSWCEYLYQHLIGSPRIIQSIITAFEQRAELGMVFPQHWEPVRPWINWGGNFNAAWSLALKMGIELTPTLTVDFPSGSMFWARSDSLRPILNLGLQFEDFPEETGQTDGTLAHADRADVRDMLRARGLPLGKDCGTAFTQGSQNQS